MNKQLFRRKSLEKITSPDRMSDYICVSNPSVWMILAAIIVLLAGVCVWGIFGRLDTILQTGGVCKDAQLILYVSEKDYEKLDESTFVSVDGMEYPVSEISEYPVEIDESFDSYLVHLTGLSAGDWVYAVTADAAGLKNGIYSADIVTESVKPIDFVRN